jgi:heptosyltransferase-2
MKRVLVAQTAFLGDCVLATSLLEAIHGEHPDWHIDVLVRKGCEGLFVGHPYVGKVLVWDKARDKYRGLFGLIGEIRANRYHIVLQAQRFLSGSIGLILSGAQHRVGYASAPLSWLFTHRAAHVMKKDWHEVDRLFGLWRPFSERAQAMRPRLYPTDGHQTAAAVYAHRPYITIAPGSVWATKQWPVHKWMELVRHINGRYRVLIIGSKAERALAQEILAGCAGLDVRDICGTTDLLTTAAIMQGAAMNYSNDSLPVHLASAVNAPMCMVYCSTVPHFGFYPLSDRAHMIEPTPLDCRPCGLHGHRTCPKGHFRCGNEVEVHPLLRFMPLH